MIASRCLCLSSHASAHSIRLPEYSPTYSPTPDLQLRGPNELPHLELTGPERIVRCHILPHTPERTGQVLIRVRPTRSGVEILHMYKGLFFVEEGAERGNRIGGFVAEYFGQGFDDAHEYVFTVYGWRLMPEVYEQLGVRDKVASSSRAGCRTSALF